MNGSPTNTTTNTAYTYHKPELVTNTENKNVMSHIVKNLTRLSQPQATFLDSCKNSTKFCL